MKPQVEDLAREWEGKIAFFTMAVGPHRDFLAQLGISGLPTFLFYSQGRESHWLAGVNTRLEEIREQTEKLLPQRV